MKGLDLSRYKKWIVLMAAFGINLTMGVNNSWSIFKKALVEDLSWSNIDASLPYTFYTVAFAVVMSFSGRMQDMYGPRIITFIGSLLLGISYLLSSLAEGLIALSLSYGLLSAIGNSFCYSTTIPTAIKWFPYEKRGFVTGIVVGGTGLAAFFTSPLASYLITIFDISSTFIILGIILPIIIFCFGRFMDNPEAVEPVNCRQLQPSDCETVSQVREYEWWEMLKTATFYKNWMMYLCSGSSGMLIISHIATIAHVQANWTLGYYPVMIIALFNTCGRFISGVLSDKYGRKIVIFFTLLIQALNMMLFVYYTNPASIMFGAAVTGLCYGSSVAFFPVAVADLYGIKNAGANYGFMFSAIGVSGILGPMLGGWAVDNTASFFSAYIFSAGLLGAAVLLSVTLKQEAKSNRLVLKL